MTINSSLSQFPAITVAMLARLKRLHVETVGDLLYHFPTRYEDYSEILAISDAILNEKASFEGIITSLESKKTWKKGLLIIEASLQDETGQIKLIWFNQKHILSVLKEGVSIRVSGKVIHDKDGLLCLTSPAFEFSQKSAVHTARLVPIYPETIGVTSKYLRWQIESILKKKLDFPDPIPQNILDKLHLPTLTQALRSIHSPKNENEQLVARKRFAFDEMFLIQIKALQIKAQWDTEKAIAFPLNEKYRQTFINKLPFQLTKAQEKAIQEIAHDLAKPSPMNRLLNGDVGSGKTIVAVLAILQVAQANHQVVILAPTEVLAKQHFESLLTFFRDEPFETALFTQAYQRIGSEHVNRDTLLQSIQSGIARVIIATHAVLQKNIRFQNLSLVIVDEQHRFGVAQRAYLQQEATTLNDGLDNAIPHFLTMTATPIPRTLTLSFFGNLDLSLLDEMPKDRKSIITRIASSQADRKYVYQFIQREITKDRQAFVILPFVEESKTMTEVKAAIAEHKRLAEDIFPHLRIGLLHGKLKSKEKESVMMEFKDKKLDILVATSVVEVGIDIPNASVCLIEDADRFGLSQLHQFRGRVGRGKHQSYCFLFPGENASASNERLQAMVECMSGFDLAEKDLSIRGPGALFGTRQSGIPDIAMENIANIRLIQIARDEARTLLSSDPHLKQYPLLQKALRQFDKTIHLE